MRLTPIARDRASAGRDASGCTAVSQSGPCLSQFRPIGPTLAPVTFPRSPVQPMQRGGRPASRWQPPLAPPGSLMRSWTSSARVRVLLAPLLLLACGGEDELGPRVPAAIVVVPNAPRIPSGQTRQLTATVVDAAGRAIEGEPMTFESSEPEIVTVTGTGLLTAVGPLGTASVTAASGELTGRIEAEVVLAPSTVLVEPAGLTLPRGSSMQLVVTVTDEDSEPVSNPSLVFTITDPGIATVDAVGFVTAGPELGAATITVSSGELSRQVPITVTATPASIAISPTSLVLARGGSFPFTATVRDEVGLPIPGLSVLWSSSNEALLVVSASGVVQSVAGDGAASVTASLGALSASAEVFIGDAPPGTILASVPLPGAWGVTTTADGGYFVSTLDGHLARGALPAMALPTVIPVNAQATDAVVDQAGTTVYVATAILGGPAGIGVVNLATNTLVDVLPVSQVQPLTVALSADESKVIVGTGEGYQVVDIASRTILGGQVVGSINTITRHPTKPLLYATVTGSSVLEIDAVTGDLERTFPLSGGVQGNAVSPDGARLYVADEVTTSVHVVNLATGVEEPSIATAGGFGLAVSPDGAHLYLAKWDQVRIVDRATGALLRTVTVSGSARRIAFASNGVAVVTNESGWVDFIE